jgi:hypothetical protein
MNIREERRPIGPAIVWWSALGIFGISLLLPIQADWSQPAVGGWYAYLWGLIMAPTALVYILVAPVMGGPGSNPSRRDLLEVLFLCTWFANPLCHIATPLLYPSPTRVKRRVCPLIATGLAFGLALLAGFLDVGSSYRSLQRSPAYFAWVASMGIMLVRAQGEFVRSGRPSAARLPESGTDTDPSPTQ